MLYNNGIQMLRYHAWMNSLEIMLGGMGRKYKGQIECESGSLIWERCMYRGPDGI